MTQAKISIGVELDLFFKFLSKRTKLNIFVSKKKVRTVKPNFTLKTHFFAKVTAEARQKHIPTSDRLEN